MKLLQLACIAALSSIGTLAIASTSDDFKQSTCYISQSNQSLTKTACGVYQEPQGDHHYTVLKINGEEYLLGDEYTYPDDLALDGYYSYFINGDGAIQYFRDAKNYQILNSTDDLDSLICYKSKSVEVCYE